MKKIGIATCFIDNYGACLQAFALQSKIEQLGYESEILRYVEPAGYGNHRNIVKKILHSQIIEMARCFFFPAYRKKIIFKQECDKFRVKNLHFSKKKLRTIDDVKKESSIYDAFVCGSDQIWNPTFYGRLNKVYYLDFADNKKRIAYAPSIGISEIAEEYQSEFKRLVGKFDYISVREQTGCNLIRKYSGKDARVVLDPTLLLSGAEWIKKVSEEKAIRKSFPKKGEKYIFCYLFGNRPFYYSFINEISKKYDLKVYIVPFYANQEHMGYNLIYDAGPLGFVELISHASLVITDSFHATAFSINLNTPFYTLLRDNPKDAQSMNSRVIDILNLTQLQSRLWIDENDINAFTMDIDWNKANSIVQSKREADLKFLKDALEA